MRDTTFKDVTFDSFVKLANMVRAEKKWRPIVYLQYDGSQLYGDLIISISHVTAAEKKEFLKRATEILEF